MNYQRIARALDFYIRNGYTYIDVPWVADYVSVLKTAPEGAQLFHINYPTEETYPSAPFLVASAEQSFLMLAKQGKLDKNTKYVACTPCFRAERELDELHQLYFMKIELFSLNPEAYRSLISDAHEFFFTQAMNSKFMPFPVYNQTGENTLDIELNDIEIGSYYKRDNYCCGTGLAEPRFSIALSKHE